MKKSIIVVVLFAIVMSAYWFFYHKDKPASYQGVLDILEVAKESNVITNPLEKMPSTNPLDDVVNPFEEIEYKNPFK
ncbi:MAG: hypothetical protein ABH967_01010 [Patescibacteria group bacterium]